MAKKPMSAKALAAQPLGEHVTVYTGAAAQVQHLPPALLSRHPLNARIVPRSPTETADLVSSVREVGVLVPAIVTPLDDGGYGVVAGWGRVAASATLDLPTVPCIVVENAGDTLTRISVVENEVRAAMHPVDQWRAVQHLMKGGATLTTAGNVLGISYREAMKLRRLGDIHPTLLDAMVEHGMPQDHLVGRIANADRTRQLEALVTGTVKSGKRTWVEWQTVSNACRVTRIPRSWALFDTAKAAVEFAEDLFAEPNSPEAFGTTDTAGFQAAQQAAIVAYCDEHGPVAVAMPWDDTLRGPMVPKAWRATSFLQEVPKDGPPAHIREDQRLVLSLRSDGAVVARIFTLPEAKAAKAPDDVGIVAAKPPRLMTDAGLQMAAEMKRAAFVQSINDMAKHPESNAIFHLLRALLMCLDAKNVVPGAAEITGRVPRLNTYTTNAENLIEVARQTVGAMLVFSAPKQATNSGAVADQIAEFLGSGEHLPRCDTRAFLAECSGALLKEAAGTVTMSPGQRAPKGVDALREFLVGKLPDWRPVTFDAPDEAG